MATVKGKIACISGGVSGIGFQFAKYLIKNGIKGILLADINEELASQAICRLEEYGDARMEFIKVDLTSKHQAACMLEKTVTEFDQLDILINNAGILSEINYERMIKVNYISMLYATILGLYKYIPKYKSGHDGIIINNASVFGIQPGYSLPIHSACKHAIIGIGRAFGNDYYYNRYKAKILTICPGVTFTPFIVEKNLDIDVKAFEKETRHYSKQKSFNCGRCLIDMLEDAENGSIWVSEGEESYKWPIQDRHKIKETLLNRK